MLKLIGSLQMNRHELNSGDFIRQFQINITLVSRELDPRLHSHFSHFLCKKSF
jgi:hypothetical protein